MSLVFLLCSTGLLHATSYTNGQAARAVLGQGVFTDGLTGPVENNLQTATQYLLGGASGLAYYNNRIYVADDNTLGATPEYNRVIAFDTTQIPGVHDDTSTFAHPSSRCWVCGYIAAGLIGQNDYRGTNSGRASAPSATAGSLNQPVGVATDGQHFAIADVNNNRVLLWNSIPASQSTPADIVLGQANATSFQSPQVVNANSLRGPQGVWFQNGKLFVADTQNYRVLVWNTIPTSNNQPADFVLGQPNLVSAIHPPATTASPATNASQLLNPVSVTSDGTHLFVSDLGYNRVLIWNSIPSSNGQPSDIVVGQSSMTTSNSNNAPAVCASNGTDSSGNPTYPVRCEATLNFPRFALAAGGKFYIADGGNDRVLVFNSVPTANGAKADNVLGQPDFNNDIVTNTAASLASTAVDNTASVDTLQTPTSLAWDGSNLYVADPFNRRVVLYSPAEISLPSNSVVNWASEIIRQEGVVVLTGTPVASDTATITIAGTAYVYTEKSKDTRDLVAQGLVALINAGAGDPKAQAIFGGAGTGSIYLSSKASNLGFDSISLAATSTNSTNVTTNLAATASGGYLTAGTSATGAPGMLVEINAQAGQTLSDQTVSALQSAPPNLPTTLGQVQVFVDGIPAPILSVSPQQVVVQLGYTLFDRNSVSIVVRTQRADGSITATNATPVSIAPANPGLFNAQAFAGQARPWPAAGALHQLGNPNVAVSIDGSVKAGDVATITIAGKAYNYTVVAADTLQTITQNLINQINNAPDPNVTASVGAAFTRVVLTARQSGGAGTGIPVSGSVNTGATVTVTAYTSATCCNVPQGMPLSASSPAIPGELITLLGSGLGALSDTAAQAALGDGGKAFNGTVPNTAAQSVSATMSGVTAQIVSAGLPLGSYGVYYVQMIVPSNLSANNTTQVYIAQNAFISNTVTIPVANPGTVVAEPGAGVAGVAKVLVSPTNLVFAMQRSGQLAFGPQVITIHNPGNVTLNILNITIGGANASDFTVSQNPCPAALSPGSSCAVSVSYTPTGSSVQSASLVINNDSAVSPQTVVLTGVTTTGFEIINQLTGKALDVTGGSNADGAKIQQYEVHSGENQRWTLIPTNTPGQFAIMNVQSGKVLDVTDNSLADTALIQQYTYLGTPNQLWTLETPDNGYYVIRSVSSNKVLDVTGALFANQTPIQQYTYIGNPNQRWKFTSIQTFQIQSVGTGKVLDVLDGLSDNAVPIQQWEANGSLQQQWFIMPVDATYFRIIGVRALKSLDVTGGSNAANTRIQQWDYAGTGNQLWALVPTGGGAFAIINKQSGRALDVTNASPDNGALIQQYDYIGGLNQQWRLLPTSTPGL